MAKKELSERAKAVDSMLQPFGDAAMTAPESALGAALAGVLDKLPEDAYEDGQTERAPLLYVQVRQKDLKDEQGRLARPAGGFRSGNVADLTYEDAGELLLTIVGFKPGRVYFEKLTDAKPSRRSDDMKVGTREREVLKGRPVYGECATCWLGQWGSAEGGRQACRENRRILAIDWSNERPIVLTIGPSSLKNWIAYANSVQDEAKRLKRDGKAPFIHHLLQVKAVPEYRPEPAGHYVVKWADRAPLPIALQEQMIGARAELVSRFQEAVRAQQYESDDYKGAEDSDGGAPPF